MPTAKPRLQGEVYSPKSCDPGRDEGNCATGLCSTFGLFGRGGLLTIELLAFNRCIFQSCYLFYLNIQHFRSKLNLPTLKKSIKFFYPTILYNARHFSPNFAMIQYEGLRRFSLFQALGSWDKRKKEASERKTQGGLRRGTQSSSPWSTISLALLALIFAPPQLLRT